jgi:hypothetical protein
MKRDMDLVRRILLDVEAADREMGLGDFDYDGKTELNDPPKLGGRSTEEELRRYRDMGLYDDGQGN